MKYINENVMSPILGGYDPTISVLVQYAVGLGFEFLPSKWKCGRAYKALKELEPLIVWGIVRLIEYYCLKA